MFQPKNCVFKFSSTAPPRKYIIIVKFSLCVCENLWHGGGHQPRGLCHRHLSHNPVVNALLTHLPQSSFTHKKHMKTQYVITITDSVGILLYKKEKGTKLQSFFTQKQYNFCSFWNWFNCHSMIHVFFFKSNHLYWICICVKAITGFIIWKGEKDLYVI